MQSKLFRFIFFFLIFLLIFQLFSSKQTSDKNLGDVVINAKSKFVIGKEVTLTIENNSNKTLKVPTNCPKNPLFSRIL